MQKRREKAISKPLRRFQRVKLLFHLLCVRFLPALKQFAWKLLISVALEGKFDCVEL